MRIFWITSKLNFETAGGSVEEIDFFIRTLMSLGHSVTAVTTHSEKNIIPHKLPYPVIERRFDSYRPLRIHLNLYRTLKDLESEADAFVVDGHLFMYGAGAYRLLGGTVPVAAFMNQFMTCWPQYISASFPQPHTSYVRRLKRAVRYLLERVFGVPLANRVDMFAFVSPTLRAMYENFGIRSGPRDMVVGDPIDMAGIMKKAGITEQSYRERFAHDGPIVLFYSSRMSPGKGFDVLLQGFARVTRKERFRVVLGGTGPEEKYVRAMIRDLGLGAYVDVPGWVPKEKLFDYYKTADIFIQADWWPAGTSISLLYALAFGVPSILPGGGGLEWNAGEGALYFPYRDVEALAHRIEELGSDPELRAQLSKNCYARLRKQDVDYPSLIADFATRLSRITKK